MLIRSLLCFQVDNFPAKVVLWARFKRIFLAGKIGLTLVHKVLNGLGQIFVSTDFTFIQIDQPPTSLSFAARRTRLVQQRGESIRSTLRRPGAPIFRMGIVW